MKTSTEKLLLSCSSSLISFVRFLFDTTRRDDTYVMTFNFDTPIDDHHPAIKGEELVTVHVRARVAEFESSQDSYSQASQDN